MPTSFPPLTVGLGRIFNLTGNRHASTATELDLAADAAVFRNATTGALVYIASISSKAINIATSGPAAGGRDQSGSFSSGSTVHFYLIAKDDGTVAGTASLTAPGSGGPTLPTGYTMWVYATTLVMTGTDLFLCYVRGNALHYPGQQNIVNAASATTETSIDMSAVVPANALTFFLTSRAIDDGTHGDYTASIRVVTGTNVHSIKTFIGEYQYSSRELPFVAQTIYYLVSNAHLQFSAWIDGYRVPN